MVNSLQNLRLPVNCYRIWSEWQTVAATDFHWMTLCKESHTPQASLLVLQECWTHVCEIIYKIPRSYEPVPLF